MHEFFSYCSLIQGLNRVSELIRLSLTVCVCAYVREWGGGGQRPCLAAPRFRPRAERGGGDVGWHPGLAQSGGALLGGHLASLEVTSWPLTSDSVLAFPADGRLGSEPALLRLSIPCPPLCGSVPGGVPQTHSSLSLAIALCLSFPSG